MEGSLVAYKVFTNGSVLNASEINDNLMNQSVMVFSNSTTRAAALTAPVEGMLTWLEDVNRYEYRNGSGAWVPLGDSKILQVVSTTKTDTFTTTSATFTDVTGLAATITPTSTSSKILIMLDYGTVDGSTSIILIGDVTRGGTPVGVGDAAGSRVQAGWSVLTETALNPLSVAYSYLDSPNTTSATTYQARIRRNAGTIYVNRTNNDTDNSQFGRSVSTITLMEVAV
jgi:hypothetical protein